MWFVSGSNEQCFTASFACPILTVNHNVQAAAIVLYTQETCLYPRLNAALRDHDVHALEPFLPYVKLLLSGLYQLPLTHVQTYRGVKLELFQVGRYIACWISFNMASVCPLCTNESH